MNQDQLGGDRVPLTQEFLAHMLGTRRASVTVAAAILQKAGLIRYTRGEVNLVSYNWKMQVVNAISRWCINPGTGKGNRDVDWMLSHSRWRQAPLGSRTLGSPEFRGSSVEQRSPAEIE